jgi:hypothetical protein
VGLRQDKQREIAYFTALHRFQQLTDEQMGRFIEMVRRSRSAGELEQVKAAFKDFNVGIQTATDRYALLVRDVDIYGFDADD